MISSNLTSRQILELERERQRLEYIRCNTIIDVILVVGIIIFSLIIIGYFIVLIERGKSITITIS